MKPNNLADEVLSELDAVTTKPFFTTAGNFIKFIANANKNKPKGK